jgi:hypothetical protein
MVGERETSSENSCRAWPQTETRHADNLAKKVWLSGRP